MAARRSYKLCNPPPHTHTSQATFLYGGLLRELAHQQLSDLLGLSTSSQVCARQTAFQRSSRLHKVLGP